MWIRRPWILLVVVGVLASACNARTVGDDELDAARDRLRPQFTQAEIDDFIEGCLLDGASTVWKRMPLGGFEGKKVTPRDSEVMDGCVAEAQQRFPKPPEPKTRAEYAAVYELYLKQVDCLRGLGFKVDNPPSLDTYVDSGGDWAPYDQLPMPLDAETWARWNATCPQSPWAYEDQ